jgi:VWFA-related protein
MPMCSIVTRAHALTYSGLLALLLPVVWGQSQNGRKAEPLRIPNRAPAPLFEGQQGKQETEIRFDQATGIVTLKLLVQDPNGYFIPNLRRDNFVVYEDGVRQTNATVEIEHANVSLGLLLEYGGRYQGLNKDLVAEISRASHQLLDVLGRADRITVFAYGDNVKQLADGSPVREELASVLFGLQTPEVSETNLYDALIFALKRMRPVVGRKAIILISSGVDTFSKSAYEDVLAAARDCNTPVYALYLGSIQRQAASLHDMAGLLARVDWKETASRLREIARVSGGRLYSPASTMDLTATYDDIMENLRVRYVISYKSSNADSLNARRTVRVELVNPKTGGLLQITDSNGKAIQANVTIQDSYTPSAVSGEPSH